MDEKKAIEVADLHLEDSHEVAKNSALRADDELEHQLTVAYVVKHHKTLIWWTFYWAMCAVGWGFDAQVNGAMISVPAFRRDFGYIFEGEAVLPARWQTAFNVISTPGQLIGGFLCSSIADSFGRKNSLLIGIILCTGGIIGQLFSATRIAFLCSKLVLGFGLGFYLTIGPLCTSEVAPVVLRGIATAGVNLGIAIGQLLSNAAVAGFGERDDHWAYRGPFALQLLFAVFLLVLLPFAPESPWWLVKKGKTEQAKKALEKLYGANVDIEDKPWPHTAALATATQAVFGLAMNFAIPYMVNPDEGNLKGKVGFIFGGLGALATIWAWFFVPELKGRTFDEIDRMFSDRIPPRKMGTHVLL
ncbi:hypothetical protein D6C78_03627 [Aureobasidium pullulans]|uniref:Major facilitator superfamily (MFS) profile domain-containing protein n=1 Tax=Aureobasidium pullulans TaxID=5580 RepID=A0A4T0BWE9_AURPU|nr:hypothetical protein D6C78_03627 [Aureobasidium pullulans]